MKVLEWYLSLLGNNSEIINQVFGWLVAAIFVGWLFLHLFDKESGYGEMTVIIILGFILTLVAFERGVAAIAILTIPLVIATPFMLAKYVINRIEERKELARRKEYDRKRNTPEKDSVDFETYK